MEYKELLEKLQTNLQQASNGSLSQPVVATVDEDIPTLLNKIGLEVQRQGGY